MVTKTSQNKLAPSKQKGLPPMEGNQIPRVQPENSSGNVGRDRRPSSLKAMYECMNCGARLFEDSCAYCGSEEIIYVDYDSLGDPPH